MESKFRYRLSHLAKTDLDDIVSYIAVELANPQAATKFSDSLERTIDEVCTFPESGSPVNNEFLSNKEVRKKFVGNYIIYYVPVPNEKLIYVIRIVYGKRNMDNIFRELNF